MIQIPPTSSLLQKLLLRPASSFSLLRNPEVRLHRQRHPFTFATTRTTTSWDSHTVARSMSSSAPYHHDDHHDNEHTRMVVEDMIQSTQHYYGSLHDAGAHRPTTRHFKNEYQHSSLTCRCPKTDRIRTHINSTTNNAAAAEANSMMHALVQEQTRTIQSIVPWFMDNMPASYFQQIPTQYRMQHIKAITAITDANMELHLNLVQQSHHGRHVYTYIRPTTKSGTLLQMVKELPFSSIGTVPKSPITRTSTNLPTSATMMPNSSANAEAPTQPILPLSRLHLFSTKDDS